MEDAKVVLATRGPAVAATSAVYRVALQDLFNVFDADGGGSLDAEEIIVLLEAFGRSGADAAKVLKSFDADESGSLEMEEFMSLMAHPLEGEPDAGMVEQRKIFVAKRLRESGLGAERSIAVRRLLSGVSLTPAPPVRAPAARKAKAKPRARAPQFSQRELLRDLFRVFDVDSGGTLDVDEVIFLLEAFGRNADDAVAMIAAFDADGSGDLDVDEFIAMVGVPMAGGDALIVDQRAELVSRRIREAGLSGARRVALKQVMSTMRAQLATGGRVAQAPFSGASARAGAAGAGSSVITRLALARKAKAGKTAAEADAAHATLGTAASAVATDAATAAAQQRGAPTSITTPAKTLGLTPARKSPARTPTPTPTRRARAIAARNASPGAAARQLPLVADRGPLSNSPSRAPGGGPNTRSVTIQVEEVEAEGKKKKAVQVTVPCLFSGDEIAAAESFASDIYAAANKRANNALTHRCVGELVISFVCFNSFVSIRLFTRGWNRSESTARPIHPVSPVPVPPLPPLSASCASSSRLTATSRCAYWDRTSNGSRSSPRSERDARESFLAVSS
jgi:Ca2+-binding EF-hand superfamily protein